MISLNTFKRSGGGGEDGNQPLIGARLEVPPSSSSGVPQSAQTEVTDDGHYYNYPSPTSESRVIELNSKCHYS